GCLCCDTGAVLGCFAPIASALMSPGAGPLALGKRSAPFCVSFTNVPLSCRACGWGTIYRRFAVLAPLAARTRLPCLLACHGAPRSHKRASRFLLRRYPVRRHPCPRIPPVQYKLQRAGATPLYHRRGLPSSP